MNYYVGHYSRYMNLYFSFLYNEIKGVLNIGIHIKGNKECLYTNYCIDDFIYRIV